MGCGGRKHMGASDMGVGGVVAVGGIDWSVI